MCKRASIIICLEYGGVQVKNFLHMLSEYEELGRYQLVFAYDAEEEAYFRGLIRKYFREQDVSCFKTQNICHKSRVYNKAAELASGDAIVFVDTNIVLLDNCVEELVCALEKTDVMAAQPLMIQYHASRVYSTGYVYSGNWSGHALQNRGIHEKIVNHSAVRNALSLSMLAINRYVFEELRGFNEHIPCEAIGRELTERITDYGYLNFYNHKSRVYFMEPEELPGVCQFDEYCGMGRSELLMKEQISEFKLEEKYAVLNFSEIVYVREIVRRLGFRTIMCRNYSQWCNQRRIDFEEIMPLSLTEQKQDFLYVVNNFYQIKDNPIWFGKRRKHQDMIVDLSGNVIRVADYWKE